MHPPRNNRGGVIMAVVLILSGMGLGALLLSHFRAPGDDPDPVPRISSSAEAQETLENGRLAEAKKAFHQALARDPKNVSAIRGLAFCAKAEGDNLASTSLLRTWTELEPGSAAAWREFALALRDAGRQLETMRAVRSGLEIAPEDPVLKLLAAEGSQSPVARPPSNVRTTPEEAANVRRAGR